MNTTELAHWFESIQDLVHKGQFEKIREMAFAEKTKMYDGEWSKQHHAYKAKWRLLFILSNFMRDHVVDFLPEISFGPIVHGDPVCPMATVDVFYKGECIGALFTGDCYDEPITRKAYPKDEAVWRANSWLFATINYETVTGSLEECTMELFDIYANKMLGES